MLKFSMCAHNLMHLVDCSHCTTVQRQLGKWKDLYNNKKVTKLLLKSCVWVTGWWDIGRACWTTSSVEKFWIHCRYLQASSVWRGKRTRLWTDGHVSSATVHTVCNGGRWTPQIGVLSNFGLPSSGEVSTGRLVIRITECSNADSSPLVESLCIEDLRTARITLNPPAPTDSLLHCHFLSIFRSPYHFRAHTTKGYDNVPDLQKDSHWMPRPSTENFSLNFRLWNALSREHSRLPPFDALKFAIDLNNWWTRTSAD